MHVGGQTWPARFAGSRGRTASVVEILRMRRANLRELAQRPRQMSAQMFLRFLRLTARNRLCDQLVMANDILRLAGRGQVQPAQPVDMATAALHQCPDVLLVGGLIE